MTTKNKCLWTMTGIPAAIMSVVCTLYIAVFIAANVGNKGEE